eukprot:TRINITY_DN13008_c0_g1_i1.p1 TRINITY_DN13008_c0_g1~~TRINITY_DN13008_c0_g1_i1.p1  ORF type:complete len:398 (-),score=67.20 TRINITY_DN13008_c0_g1_i1:117-1310(-)
MFPRVSAMCGRTPRALAAFQSAQSSARQLAHQDATRLQSNAACSFARQAPKRTQQLLFQQRRPTSSRCDAGSVGHGNRSGRVTVQTRQSSSSSSSLSSYSSSSSSFHASATKVGALAALFPAAWLVHQAILKLRETEEGEGAPGTGVYAEAVCPSREDAYSKATLKIDDPIEWMETYYMHHRPWAFVCVWALLAQQNAIPLEPKRYMYILALLLKSYPSETAKWYENALAKVVESEETSPETKEAVFEAMWYSGVPAARDVVTAHSKKWFLPAHLKTFLPSLMASPEPTYPMDTDAVLTSSDEVEALAALYAISGAAGEFVQRLLPSLPLILEGIPAEGRVVGQSAYVSLAQFASRDPRVMSACKEVLSGMPPDGVTTAILQEIIERVEEGNVVKMA